MILFVTCVVMAMMASTQMSSASPINDQLTTGQRDICSKFGQEMAEVCDLFEKRYVMDKRTAYGLIESIVEQVLAEVADMKRAAESIVAIAAVGGEMLLHALQQFVDSHRVQLGDTLADLITKLIDIAMKGLDPIVDEITDFVGSE